MRPARRDRPESGSVDLRCEIPSFLSECNRRERRSPDSMSMHGRPGGSPDPTIGDWLRSGNCTSHARGGVAAVVVAVGDGGLKP